MLYLHAARPAAPGVASSFPRGPPVMPVAQVLWAGGAIFPHDKVAMLMLYEVEKFKEVTSVLHSVSSSEVQFSRRVMLPQASLLTPRSKPVFMPGGQAHFRTRAGSLGTASQWKKSTGAGSEKQRTGQSEAHRKQRSWPSTMRRQHGHGGGCTG